MTQIARALKRQDRSKDLIHSARWSDRGLMELAARTDGPGSVPTASRFHRRLPSDVAELAMHTPDRVVLPGGN